MLYQSFHRADCRNLILVGQQLARTKQDFFAFGIAKLAPQRRTFGFGQLMILCRVCTDTVNALHLRGKLCRSKVIILLRDGDELVRMAAHKLLHRIPDEPVFLRRTLIKVEAMSGIEYLGAALAGFSCSQPSHNTAHRRIAVDHIVAALTNDLFELLVGSKIFR